MTNEFYINMLKNAIKEIQNNPFQVNEILDELARMLLGRKENNKKNWNFDYFVPYQENSSTEYDSNSDPNEIKIT